MTGDPAPASTGGTPVVIVAGPTATGKTALAARIAEQLHGIVINADSMQVYADLRVLTARPTAAEQARAPHRLYGFRPITEPCSVAAWCEMARDEIRSATVGNRLAILCGGTGLYLRALTRGLAHVPDIPDTIRQAARDRFDRLGGPAFRQALAARDPDTARRLNDHDRQRLLRAWEVVKATGRPLSAWLSDPVPDPGIRTWTIVLMSERATLYQACNNRFETMITNGALEEARQLMAGDPDPALPGMKALGLPHLIAHLRGDLSLERAIDRAQRDTRHYAKRQCTWFRHQVAADLVWHDGFSEERFNHLLDMIRAFLAGSNAAGSSRGTTSQSPTKQQDDTATGMPRTGLQRVVHESEEHANNIDPTGYTH